MDEERQEVISSRRTFLAAALAGAATSLGAPRTRLIDVHHHPHPDFWKKAASSTIQWTPELSLASMDKSGVTTSISSITAPGVWLGDIQQGRSLSRQCNEYMAQLGKDHPGRFGFFAAIPVPDTEGSLKEIAYALDILKADGIGLLTSYNDKWPGEAAFAPVFEDLNRRKAVVYFHPTGAACCSNLMANVRPQIIEYPHDSTRAVLSMLLAGTFVKFRDIRFIFSHGGGTIPFLAGRIKQMTAQQLAPQEVDLQLKRLYYEIANASSAPSMAALMKLVPLAQIMFGSDYPYVPTEVTADGLHALGLPAAKLAAIARGNALNLLPKLR